MIFILNLCKCCFELSTPLLDSSSTSVFASDARFNLPFSDLLNAQKRRRKERTKSKFQNHQKTFIRKYENRHTNKLKWGGWWWLAACSSKFIISYRNCVYYCIWLSPLRTKFNRFYAAKFLMKMKINKQRHHRETEFIKRNIINEKYECVTMRATNEKKNTQECRREAKNTNNTNEEATEKKTTHTATKTVESERKKNRNIYAGLL